MNALDIAVLVLVALFAFAGYKRGLIHTVYRLASLFIAIALSRILFPYIARLLQGTYLYTMIQGGIKHSLNLEGFVTEYTAGRQTEIIESLPLPVQLRGLLHAQFVPDVHGILRVDTIEEYISAFFANIAINGIAIVVVFAVVLGSLSVIGAVLDVIGKLPVIRTFNNFGGLAVGVVMGVGISWLSIIIFSMFFATSANPEGYELIQNSFFARSVLDSMIRELTVV